jgi:hypothetical protein
MDLPAVGKAGGELQFGFFFETMFSFSYMPLRVRVHLVATGIARALCWGCCRKGFCLNSF